MSRGAVVTLLVAGQMSRRSMRLSWLAILAFVAVTAACALRPVCVPLSSAELAQFNTPIEMRTDRDFYLRIFQLRDGQWHQCKTWLSRQFFF